MDNLSKYTQNVVAKEQGENLAVFYMLENLFDSRWNVEIPASWCRVPDLHIVYDFVCDWSYIPDYYIVGSRVLWGNLLQDAKNRSHRFITQKENNHVP